MSFSVFGGALPPSPYTVQVSWLDPLAGPIMRRTGVYGPLTSAAADLHLPLGRTVPLGGAIEAYVQISAQVVGPPLCALLIGFQPGSTTLPNGAVVPLVPDVLVLASLSGALWPFLAGSPGTAVPAGPVCYGYCGPGLGGFTTGTVSGISLSHPGAAASGAVLRLAAVAISPPGTWIASQGQEITLQ
jgi:hypothetical protein